MKTFLLVLFCLTLPIAATSQDNPQFLERAVYEVGTDYMESLSEILIANDGTLLHAGIRYYVNDWDLLLTKTDYEGNVIWDHLYGFTAGDEGTPTLIAIDGGYAVLGITQSVPDNQDDLFMAVVDEDGNEIWTNTYGTEQYEGFMWSWEQGLIQTADGGYAICTSRGTSISRSARDGWVVRLEADGDTLWTRQIGQDDWYDSFICINEEADGSLVIGGTTETQDWRSDDFCLVKLDADGNTLWQNSFGIEDRLTLCEMTATADGGYLLAGHTKFGTDDGDLVVAKADALGDNVWLHRFTADTLDGLGNIDEIQLMPMSLVESDYGEIFISAWRGGMQQDQCRGYVLAVSAEGDSLTSLCCGCPVPSWAGELVEVDNGFWDSKEFYIGGFYDNDGQLIKVNYYPWWSGVERAFNFLPATSVVLPAYPNPFNAATNLTFELPSPSFVRVSVFNTLGEEVTVLSDDWYSPGQHSLRFDASGLSSGTYFIRTSAAEYFNSTQKVVLLK